MNAYQHSGNVNMLRNKFKNIANSEIEDSYTNAVNGFRKLTSELLKLSEIDPFDALKKWRSYYDIIMGEFKNIHSKGGQLMSYMVAEAMVDKIEEISQSRDKDKIRDKSTQESGCMYADLFNKSYDLCHLMGAFEKPIVSIKRTKQELMEELERKFK